VGILSSERLSSFYGRTVIYRLSTLVLPSAPFAVIYVTPVDFLVTVCGLGHVEAVQRRLLRLQLVLCGRVTRKLAVVILECDARVLEEFSGLLMMEHWWACKALLGKETTSKGGLGGLVLMLEGFVGATVGSLAE
jgi:hypothetical protein